MASASDKGCGDVNQYWFSFGLDDRDWRPYCNKVLYSLIALRYINGITPPKLQALARRDTPALTKQWWAMTLRSQNALCLRLYDDGTCLLFRELEVLVGGHAFNDSFEYDYLNGVVD